MMTINIVHVTRAKTAARECHKTGTLHHLGRLLSEIGNLAELMREDADQRGPVDPKDYTAVLEQIIFEGDLVAQSVLRSTATPPEEKSA
jgi:hypothetical protein